MFLADVGEDHTENNDTHCNHLEPAEMGETHEDSRDCGENRKKVLINGNQFGTDVFNCGFDEEIGNKSYAEEDE